MRSPNVKGSNTKQKRRELGETISPFVSPSRDISPFFLSFRLSSHVHCFALLPAAALLAATTSLPFTALTTAFSLNFFCSVTSCAPLTHFHCLTTTTSLFNGLPRLRRCHNQLHLRQLNTTDVFRITRPPSQLDFSNSLGVCCVTVPPLCDQHGCYPASIVRARHILLRIRLLRYQSEMFSHPLPLRLNYSTAGDCSCCCLCEWCLVFCSFSWFCSAAAVVYVMAEYVPRKYRLFHWIMSLMNGK